MQFSISNALSSPVPPYLGSGNLKPLINFRASFIDFLDFLSFIKENSYAVQQSTSNSLPLCNTICPYSCNIKKSTAPGKFQSIFAIL